MTDDPIADRKGKSFKEAEGLVTVPTQLGLGEVTQQMRSLLFFVFEQMMPEVPAEYAENRLGQPWSSILRDNHVFREHKMSDEYSGVYARNLQRVKNIITHADYAELFDFIQYVLQHRLTPTAFSHHIESALETSRSAYRVVQEKWIAPLLTEADRVVVATAFEDVSSYGLAGARTHLREAVGAASSGHWAQSINASIDALEAAVRTITGKNAFADAIKELELRAGLHKALGNSIRRFYDFTSDEKGLRHSNAELENANVDEGDALYALGTCSAAISMLTRKAQKAGLLPN